MDQSECTEAITDHICNDGDTTAATTINEDGEITSENADETASQQPEDTAKRWQQSAVNTVMLTPPPTSEPLPDFAEIIAPLDIAPASTQSATATDEELDEEEPENIANDEISNHSTNSDSTESNALIINEGSIDSNDISNAAASSLGSRRPTVQTPLVENTTAENSVDGGNLETNTEFSPQSQQHIETNQSNDDVADGNSEEIEHSSEINAETTSPVECNESDEIVAADLLSNCERNDEEVEMAQKQEENLENVAEHIEKSTNENESNEWSDSSANSDQLSENATTNHCENVIKAWNRRSNSPIENIQGTAEGDEQEAEENAENIATVPSTQLFNGTAVVADDTDAETTANQEHIVPVPSSIDDTPNQHQPQHQMDVVDFVEHRKLKRKLSDSMEDCETQQKQRKINKNQITDISDSEFVLSDTPIERFQDNLHELNNDNCDHSTKTLENNNSNSCSNNTEETELASLALNKSSSMAESEYDDEANESMEGETNQTDVDSIAATIQTTPKPAKESNSICLSPANSLMTSLPHKHMNGHDTQLLDRHEQTSISIEAKENLKNQLLHGADAAGESSLTVHKCMNCNTSQFTLYTELQQHHLTCMPSNNECNDILPPVTANLKDLDISSLTSKANQLIVDNIKIQPPSISSDLSSTYHDDIDENDDDFDDDDDIDDDEHDHDSLSRNISNNNDSVNTISNDSNSAHNPNYDIQQQQHPLIATALETHPINSNQIINTSRPLNQEPAPHEGATTTTTNTTIPVAVSNNKIINSSYSNNNDNIKSILSMALATAPKPIIEKAKTPSSKATAYGGNAILSKSQPSSQQIMQPPNQQQHQLATTNQFSAQIRIRRQVFLCSACGDYYEKWNLFYHIREVHNKFICLFCLGIFSNAERLVNHLESKHIKKPDVYENKDELIRSIHDQCFLMCCVCEHIFSEHDDFTGHSCENFMKPCTVCGLKFIHKTNCSILQSNKLSKHKQKKAASIQRQLNHQQGASPAAPHPSMSQFSTDYGHIELYNQNHVPTQNNTTLLRNALMDNSARYQQKPMNMLQPQIQIQQQQPPLMHHSHQQQQLQQAVPLIPFISDSTQKTLMAHEPMHTLNPYQNQINNLITMQCLQNQTPLNQFAPNNIFETNNKLSYDLNQQVPQAPQMQQQQPPLPSNDKDNSNSDSSSDSDDSNNSDSSSDQSDGQNEQNKLTTVASIKPNVAIRYPPVNSGKNINNMLVNKDTSFADDQNDDEDLDDSFDDKIDTNSSPYIRDDNASSYLNGAQYQKHTENADTQQSQQEQPLLVPKLKLKLTRDFQTSIESEQSSTESDEESEVSYPIIK